MDFLKKFDWSFKSIAKIIGLVVLGIIALSIVIALISFSLRTIMGTTSVSQSYPKYDYAMEEMASPMMARGGIGIVPPMSGGGYSTGSDAEDYEVKEYDGQIKTRKLDKICDVFLELKKKTYIIFETSDKGKDSCYFRFKVEKDKADEVVKIIEALDPETFNARIETIKKAIEDYESEIEILTNKLNSIEETLTNAQESYDEIQKIATRQQDAETLAKIIDSKLNLIEKLSREKLSVKEQIDRYNKSKSNQLDRLNYTFFNIHIVEDLIFDWENIKDNWKFETKLLVDNFNDVIQSISLHLVTYLIRFAQVALYLFITLFLLKLVWVGVKRVWKGRK